MKYFTKQWYMDCQCSGLHFSLEESKEAAVYSEEYFQALYQQRLNEFLQARRQMQWMPGDEPANEESPGQLEKDFSESLEFNVKHYLQRLPPDILDKIADMRVLALNKATKSNIRRIRAFSDKKQAQMLRTVKSYQRYYKKAIPAISHHMDVDYSLHDFEVKGSAFENNDFVLFLDGKGEGSALKEIRFENARIIMQEHDFNKLSNAFWIYDEIYRTADGVELHVLLDVLPLETDELVLSELIVQTSYIRHR